MMNDIVFSDLDGTLLDYEDYSFDAAAEGLQLLRKKEIPLILCSSKTCAEIQYWQEQLQVDHPFISENGGGIFIPKSYFPFEIDFDYEDATFFVIQLGVEIDQLLQVMGALKQQFDLQSFAEMSAKEIAADAHLPLHLADLARRRDYDLPFKMKNPQDEQRILREIESHHLRCIKGGRYYHLTGGNDKGRAVQLLIKLFEKKEGSLKTIGIGDSDNDFPMLDAVDHPYLVKRTDGTFASAEYHHVEAVGPKGWNLMILTEIGKDQ